MLRLASPALYSHLAELFNLSFDAGVFPSEWKHASIVALSKVPSPATPSDTRPISLLPEMSKVLERLAHAQLTDFLEQRNLLDARSMDSGQGTRPKRPFLNSPKLLSGSCRCVAETSADAGGVSTSSGGREATGGPRREMADGRNDDGVGDFLIDRRKARLKCRFTGTSGDLGGVRIRGRTLEVTDESSRVLIERCSTHLELCDGDAGLHPSRRGCTSTSLPARDQRVTTHLLRRDVRDRQRTTAGPTSG
ncbi:unnamed protein product [Trichogramma brassicae]|uniref:Reverse transcriptase domain-containing protein n=1 Tax=Trichogramma brassicae TaxID=86971 RepID=A0A6H5IBR9_9HYME|nr:unnamed protein product [Trichogramma brassicae]